MKNRRLTKIIAIIGVVAMLASFFAINATADETTIAASGYAAIGIVDAGANKAEVLLGTGEQGTVIYAGEAPITGGVYRYTRDENNVYTFYTPDANFGNSSVNDASKGYWYSFTSVNGYMWNYNGVENLFFWSVNSPVFLRASKTEWMLGTNACFVEGTMVASYYLDITENASGHPHYNVSAFVFGGLEADGTVNISGFDTLKLPEAKYDLGAFTTPLHPVAEPEQPSEPETPEVPEGSTRLEIVSPKRLTTVFGKYTDGTGADESTFVDGKDGYCVTDGWYGRAGYAECDDIDGLVALIMDIDSAIKFGGIEIVAHDSNGEGSGDIYTFAVQALVDGEWVEVASEEEYLFDATRAYTASFDAVETSKVRILIPAYWDGEARIREVSLFEVKAGTPKTYVDLSDVIDGDGHNGNNGALVDGNKASVFTGSTITSNLTVDGQPTVVSGFELYHHRAGSAFAKNVTILIKKTADGDFEEIGSFATNWEEGAIQDSVFVDFDQSYAAYELKVVLDTWGYANEFAVYQYEGAVAPEQPTEPEVTEPEATEPEVTEPEATEPEATEPEATEPEATEPEATEPEATEPEATEPEATEPEATEPEATEPEATEPEATEPEATEPESNGYTASGNVVETGYAAIGVVDEALSKAQVLLGNGKIGTVYFAGTAPKTGVVYGYELHSNNVFVFIEKAANFGNSNQSDYNTAWYMWFTPNGWAWDANSPADVFHAPYPIFLNYGDNQWVLTTIDKVAETNGGAAAFGFVLDAVRDMPEFDAGNGLANHHAGALIIDAVKEDQYAHPAQLFGAAGEKVGLGSFTTDLYTPTTSGNTGDGPSKTGDVVISVLCGMFAISVIGGAVIISKKKEF